MSYYVEARKHEKSLRQLQNDHRKKAEVRAKKMKTKLGDPLQLLVVDGRACKVSEY